MALPKSKYEILCAIVAQMKNGPHGLVKAEPIAKACGYSLDVVLQNFGFFTSVGILGPGMNKHLSDEGSLLSYTLCAGDNEKIITCWRSVIDKWPDMLKMLGWIRENDGLQMSSVLDGAEALFHRDVSSSRFALNCLIHLAHRIGYVRAPGGQIRLSEYAEGLLESALPGGDEADIECFPGDKNLSVVPGPNSHAPPTKEPRDGFHIHLHFGADINPVQIESIFRSLAESVLARPGVAHKPMEPLDDAPITEINRNIRSVGGDGA